MATSLSHLDAVLFQSNFATHAHSSVLIAGDISVVVAFRLLLTSSAMDPSSQTAHLLSPSSSWPPDNHSSPSSWMDDLLPEPARCPYNPHLNNMPPRLLINPLDDPCRISPAPPSDSEQLASAVTLPKRPKLAPASDVATNKTQLANAQASARSKERLGERITALQQLVSPFGKTDTASVLSEAIGYIKFLQEQVQVLSSPYMKPSKNRQDKGDVRSTSKVAGAVESDLRSRGLCLVPVSCTLNVAANNNGADFWASSVGGGTRY